RIGRLASSVVSRSRGFCYGLRLVAPATVTATPVAAVTAPAPARAAPAPTLRSRPCFVHRQLAAATILAIQGSDGGLRLLVGLHLHEAKAFGPAGVPVHDDLGRFDRAVGFEHFCQLTIGHAITEVTNIQLPAHFLLLIKRPSARLGGLWPANETNKDCCSSD